MKPMFFIIRRTFYYEMQMAKILYEMNKPFFIHVITESDCEEALNTDFKTQIEHLHPHNPVHVNKAFHR